MDIVAVLNVETFLRSSAIHRYCTYGLYPSCYSTRIVLLAAFTTYTAFIIY